MSSITLETINRHKDRITENHVIPIKIMISAQSGCQYLMAYAPRFKRVTSFRTDNIVSIKIDEVSERFDEFQDKFENMLPHIQGERRKAAWPFYGDLSWKQMGELKRW